MTFEYHLRSSSYTYMIISSYHATHIHTLSILPPSHAHKRMVRTLALLLLLGKLPLESRCRLARGTWSQPLLNYVFSIYIYAIICCNIPPNLENLQTTCRMKSRCLFAKCMNGQVVKAISWSC